MSSTRRDDLQAIRGIAIIAVLLFHFFPKAYPNGYAGVDQFFVLSGFLMMMIFGSKAITWETSAQFYYRRVKRIVPLYILVVLIGLLLTLVIFSEGFASVNSWSAKFAITFRTNCFQRSVENNYFLQLESAYDIFTHTWSLSVEMQFYLIVPLFFYVSARVRECGSIPFKMFHFAVFATSIVYRNLAEPYFAFNSMLCRLWQFQTGIAAYMIGECVSNPSAKAISIVPCETTCDEMKNNEVLDQYINPAIDPKEQKPPTTYWKIAVHWCSLLVTLACLFSPVAFPTEAVQILATISIAIVIAYGTDVPNRVLENKALLFMGDISYSLYLVHWPVYCWVKSRYLDDPTALAAGVVTSIVISALLSKTFEKWYLKLELTGIAIFTIGCYCVIIVFLMHWTKIDLFIYRHSGGYHEDEWYYNAKFPTNLTNEEILQMTTAFAREPTFIPQSCHPRSATGGHCTINGPELGRLANNTLLVIGNSYSDNQLDQLARHFAKFASKMEKLSYPGCGVLEHFSGYGCYPRFYEFFNFTERFRPDILFIVARHIPSLEEPILDINNDTALEEAWRQLQKYESVVNKRIYILDAYKIIYKKYWNLYRNMVRNGEDINERANELACHECYENTLRRYAEIQKRCTKCVMYSYMDALSDDNGNFLIADLKTRLPIFSTSSHLTPVGQRIIDGVYERLANDLEREIVNGTFV